MKTINQGILASVACLFLTTAAQTFAIEGLKIAVRCPDVILSWPSATNETYIVQYRPDLGTNSTWVTLTNSLPAATDTNVTFFVHSNMVTCPSGGGGGGGGGGSPPSFNGAMSLVSGGIDASASVDASPLPVWVIQRRPPHPWELENRPPFPWEAGASLPAPLQRSSALGVSAFSQGADNPQPLDDSGGGGSGGDPGFYRVVRNGAHLVGITNGMNLSGVVTIPVEAGNDVGELNNLSLTEDGAPVSDASIVAPPFQVPLQLVMDTTQMSNGVHQISATASWYISGADNPYYQASSPAITINVYNEISFPKWMPLFGQQYDALYITAQSAHTNADWYVDMYGGNAGYIGTFGGHTYDGNIEVVWNLIGPPPDFLSYTNEPYFDFVVTTFFETGQQQGNGPQGAGSASAVAPGTRKNYDRWVARGDWVVANQLFWEGWVGGENLNTMTDAFVGMAETAFGLTVRPDHPYLEAFRIHYGDGSEVPTWQLFRQALYHPNSRNLFYSGHGTSGGTGYKISDTNVFITQAELTNMLHTVPVGQTNRHAFRFVFLDGCQTANGHLPEAFGIVRQENLPFEYYYNSGERYSAFIGWNKSPTAGYAGHLVNPDHWKFIQNFKYLWLNGTPLRQALNDAPNGPLGANNINPKDLTVFGYKDLGPNQNNGL